MEGTRRTQFPEDIYTKPSNVDVDTLRNLGPLRGMAGIWQGIRGLDVKPKAEGPKKQAFVEHIELQPIDPQTNGPQLFYGLRYHNHVAKPDQVKTYHDQVGYWLWEPATFGEPHKQTTEKVKTQEGAEFDKQVLDWQCKNVSIHLVSLVEGGVSNTTDEHGMVSISTNSYIDVR